MTVTAQRAPAPMSQTLAAFSVITREQIERLQATDMTELLRGLSGIDVSSHGGAGKVSSVFMRGTESDHVLVLVDGIKIGSATSGTTAFEHIPVEQIERIEIVRGPRSSLYGSEALGGVIQIFTRNTEQAGLTPSLLLSGENRGGARAQLGLSGGSDKLHFGLSAGYRRTDGIDTKPSAGEPDKDGYKQWNGSLNLNAQLSATQSIQLQAMQSYGKNEYDEAFTPGADSNDTELQVLGLGWNAQLLPAWGVRLKAGQSRDKYSNLEDGQQTSRFDTKRLHASLINDLDIGDNQQLNIGADWLKDEVEGSTTLDQQSRRDIGGFVQYQGQFGRNDIQLSWRHDDDESFGGRQTGGAAWGWQASSALGLFASWATAFRAPSFNELYFPDFGNAALDPETSRSSEIGLRGTLQNWSWSLNAYHTDVDDLIDTVEVDPDNFIYEPRNVSQARIRGIEASLGWQHQGWRVHTNLDLSDPENRSDDSNRGNLLRRRSRQSARVDVDHTLAQWQWGLSLIARGKSYEDAANSIRLPGFATVDVRLGRTLGKGWSAQAAIYNLLDKDYQTAAGYPQPGTSYRLNLRYAPAP